MRSCWKDRSARGRGRSMSNGEKGLESRALGLSAPFVSVQGSPGSLWLLICFPVDLDLGLRTGTPSGILGRFMLVVYGSSNSALCLINPFPLGRKSKLRDARGLAQRHSVGKQRSQGLSDPSLLCPPTPHTLPAAWPRPWKGITVASEWAMET